MVPHLATALTGFFLARSGYRKQAALLLVGVL